MSIDKKAKADIDTKYDGWCMRYPEAWGGQVDKRSISWTRTDLWDNFLGPYGNDSRQGRIQRYRRMGFRLVKVRVVEAGE